MSLFRQIESMYRFQCSRTADHHRLLSLLVKSTKVKLLSKLAFSEQVYICLKNSRTEPSNDRLQHFFGFQLFVHFRTNVSTVDDNQSPVFSRSRIRERGTTPVSQGHTSISTSMRPCEAKNQRNKSVARELEDQNKGAISRRGAQDPASWIRLSRSTYDHKMDKFLVAELDTRH